MTLLLAAGLLLNNDSPNAAIRNYVEKMLNRAHAPGCSVGIIRYNQPTEYFNFGVENLETQAPISEKSVFAFASTSKTIIASAVMKLVEVGKLQLNDKVTGLIKDAPSAWGEITVKQLLSHTAGLPREIEGWDESTKYSSEDLRKLMLEKLRPDSKPGDEYAYSNAGYFLLAEIISEVSGMSWDRYIQTTFLDPLSLNSFVLADQKTTTTGYDWVNGKYALGEAFASVRPSGAYNGSIADLATWAQKMMSSDAISRNSFNQMATPTILHDGLPNFYGMGLELKQFRGRKRLSHAGQISGYRTNLAMFPEEQIAIVICANSSSAPVEEMTDNIAAMVLPNADATQWKGAADHVPLTKEIFTGLRNISEGKAFGSMCADPLSNALLNLPEKAREVLKKNLEEAGHLELLRTEKITKAPEKLLGEYADHLSFFRLPLNAGDTYYQMAFNKAGKLIHMKVIER